MIASETKLLETQRALLVEFAEPQRVIGWAPFGGGLRLASRVVWFEVKNEELGLDVDPQHLLQQRLATLPHRLERTQTVAMLTSTPLSGFRTAKRQWGEHEAQAIATVGLGNALRVGEPPTAARVGTINVLCSLDVALTNAALIEAVSIVAEARTLAVLEQEIQSSASENQATGTGTDCIVVACPSTGPAEPYAGKHTAVGHLLGAVTLHVIRNALPSGA